MNKEYVKWFDKSYYYITELAGDSNIAKSIIQYNIFNDLVSCYKDVRMTKDDFGQYSKILLIELFSKLSDNIEFDEELWNSFYYESSGYKQFIEMYDLPSMPSINKMGSFWLKKIDQIEDCWSIEKKVYFVDILTNYCCWREAFTTTYAYQYFIDNMCCADIAVHRFCLLQYWEYKEIESFLDRINAYSVHEKIEALMRMYAEDKFDLQYPDRETLFIELVKNKLQIPEAFTIVHRVRRGLKLTENMKMKLCEIGYDAGFIDRLNQIHYLKSRKLSIMRLLHITNLKGES